MYGRAGVHLVKGQGNLRRRRPVSTGPLQRSDIFAGPGQQLLHLPGGWYGDLRNTGETRHRRDVHRGWAGGGGSGGARLTETRAPLSASGEHFGDRDPNGSTGGKVSVRFGPCPRR